MEIDIQKSIQFAYLCGVLHSDGCVYFFREKPRITISVSKKSLPMLNKFQNLFNEYFSKNSHYRSSHMGSRFVFQPSIVKIWPCLKKSYLDVPPNLNQIEVFSAYLGGIIDGDGHIKIKRNNDRKIPQCLIRISAEKKLEKLANYIELHFNCKVHYYHDKRSKCVETCFYISSKNYFSVKKHLLKNIDMGYKRERLSKHIIVLQENGPTR